MLCEFSSSNALFRKSFLLQNIHLHHPRQSPAPPPPPPPTFPSPAAPALSSPIPPPLCLHLLDFPPHLHVLPHLRLLRLLLFTYNFTSSPPAFFFFFYNQGNLSLRSLAVQFSFLSTRGHCVFRQLCEMSVFSPLSVISTLNKTRGAETASSGC